MLHELSMARPCREGHLYVGRPTSSEERRLVATTVARLLGRTKLGKQAASMRAIQRQDIDWTAGKQGLKVHSILFFF